MKRPRSSLNGRIPRVAVWLIVTLAPGILLAEGGQAAGAVPLSRSVVSEITGREFPALLLPDRTALIKARQDERVAEMKVRVGSRMKKGELLLRFVDDEERIAVMRAEALLDQARADHRRAEKLHGQEQVSDEYLERAGTELRLATADLELARLRLAELSIGAPFDGVVAERYVDSGASVELGDPLVRVTALTPLRLEALLPEELLPSLSETLDVVVRLAPNGRLLRLPLSLGPVVVDPASGTFLLQIRVDNRDERLTPGVSCRISLTEALREE